MRLSRRGGFVLEGTTLGWNVAGTAILLTSAVAARSVALGGFGLDSLIEIGASVVVIWELSGTDAQRRRRALRLIGVAFIVLGGYLTIQSSAVLALGFHGGTSRLGLVWTAVTALVMFALAYGKERTGRVLDNPVLRHEARVTLIDGVLASAVVGLALDATLGWWWADPVAAYVLVVYAIAEARAVLG